MFKLGCGTISLLCLLNELQDLSYVILQGKKVQLIKKCLKKIHLHMHLVQKYQPESPVTTKVLEIKKTGRLTRTEIL